MRYLSVLFLVICVSFNAFGQQPKMQYHKVQPGQTAYSIARMYGMTVEEFYEFNPEAREVLREGASVLVFAENPGNQSSTIDSSRYVFHEVQPGETVYSLTRKYDINTQILNENNPDLVAEGLRTGMVLRIPKSPKRGPLEGINSEEDAQRKIRERENARYVLHTVEKGETEYGLIRKYEITATQLVALNPDLKNGLKEGQVLRIKLKEDDTPRVTQTAQPDSVRRPFTLYRILPGDNLRRIMDLFNVTEDELRMYNPRIYEGLKPGRMLLIPLSADKKDRVKKDSSVYSLDRVYPKGKALKVALFLPLDIDYNPFDDNWDKKLLKDNQISLSFYSGVKIALDSLTHKGISFDLHVYSDKGINMRVVREMADKDLIIGPIFYKEMRNLSEQLLVENIKVPIVSPMSREVDILSLSNVYHCLPMPDHEMEVLGHKVKELYPTSPVLIIHEDRDKYKGRADNLKKLLQDSLQEVTVVAGEIDREKLENLFDVPNEVDKVIVMVGLNRVFVSTNINQISAARRTDLVLFSESELVKMPTVELPKLGRLRLVRPEGIYHDYRSVHVRRFFQHYRGIYNKDPNKYAMQGFDVAYYFGSRIFGVEETPKPLQLGFKFEQTPFGSYRNMYFHWLSLDPALNQTFLPSNP
ncbi:MAG: LysM peptidoglycan-binding domain-containing protein [Cryomorphaceae bacterium]|nr:LysM peptidoglycan-binding domain-containing protein [Cryomorphaceae bacterium]